MGTILKVFGDLGNSLLKVEVALQNGAGRAKTDCIVLPHAINSISASDFEDVRAQYGADDYGDPNYFMVDGQAYATGDSAEAYGLVKRKSGIIKYSRDYYGILFISAMLQLAPGGHDNVVVFVGHPPSDVKYRDNQMKAIKGSWSIKTSGRKTVNYRVRYVNTYLEPLGGYMNVMLNPDGETYSDNGIDQGKVLIFDIGGRISSVVPVKQGGKVEYGRQKHADVGILQVIEVLEKGLRDRYHKDFEHTRILEEGRLRDALRTGVFVGGGMEYPCSEEVQKAMSVLINRLAPLYFEDAGGPTNFDHILITGGGGGASHVRLNEELLEHRSVHLAERPDDMHLANMRGAKKLWTLLENSGMLK
jgi:hypothetical protein